MREMKQGIFTVLENRALTAHVHRLRMGGDVSAVTRAGQFVDIKIAGFFLRRPFSVCDWDADSLTLLYERVGRGTELLSVLTAGQELDVLTGLGNGFDPARGGETPLLIGGGTGLSPLYALAKELLRHGARPTVLLGFNTAEEVFYTQEFSALGLEPVVATVDGGCGRRGFVTEVMDIPHSGFYACGPEAMLRAVCERSDRPGQLSFDRRMGCGFGACMGCSIRTKSGMKRICKDGPVLDREEIIWED